MTYSFIDSNEWCLESIRELKAGSKYALDTETQGFDPHSDKLLLIQIGDGNGNINIYDARKIDNNVMKLYLEHLFEVSDKLIIHNAPFDLKILRKNYNITPPKDTIYDTGLAEWVLYNGMEKPYYSYKYLVKKYCNVEIEKEVRDEFIGYDKDYFTDEMLEYAAIDVEYLHVIHEVQMHFIQKRDLNRIVTIEGNVTPATAEMELSGVLVDTNAWLDIYQEGFKEMQEQLDKVIKTVGDMKIDWPGVKSAKPKIYDFGKEKFNPGSWQQVCAVLYATGVRYKEYDRKQKKFVDKLPDSTNADIMAKLDNEFAREVTKYRGIQKEVGTYGDTFLKHINPVTGRMHGKFNQQGARSGRYSSDNPNNQNIPVRKGPKYRNCFIARPGYVQVTSDFSHFEMRLAAEFSQDQVLIQALIEGKDLHALSAAAMYQIPFEEVEKWQRNNGKTFNFSVLYGAQAKRVSESLEIPLKDAETLVSNWRKGFPQLAGYLETQGNFVRENGYAKTGLGRIRYFDLAEKASWQIEEAVRQGTNHPIQGAAGDVLKIALCEIHYRIFDFDADLIRNVHDEITIECAEELGEAIKNIQVDEMKKAASVYLKTVPIKVDSQISREWGH